MSSRSILRTAAACAVLALTVSTSAHAQLGSLRRAAQRATGAAPGTPPVPASPAAQPSAASAVNTGAVLEMTDPVLDRFQRALEAEHTDLGQLAQRLSALKSPEQYTQCQMDFYNSAAGQEVYGRLNAAAESGDYARINAAAEAAATALKHACGDPLDAERMRQEAPAHAEAAALQAGGFSAREYAVLKERVVPFCQATGAGGAGEVRLPGDGTNIYWVYTAAETAALRPRCATLMQGLAAIS